MCHCPIPVQEARQPTAPVGDTPFAGRGERPVLHKHSNDCGSNRAYRSLMLSRRVFPTSLPTFPGSRVSFCPLLDFSELQERTGSAEGRAVQAQYARKTEILLPKARRRGAAVPSPRLLEEALIEP